MLFASNAFEFQSDPKTTTNHKMPKAAARVEENHLLGFCRLCTYTTLDILAASCHYGQWYCGEFHSAMERFSVPSRRLGWLIFTDFSLRCNWVKPNKLPFFVGWNRKGTNVYTYKNGLDNVAFWCSITRLRSKQLSLFCLSGVVYRTWEFMDPSLTASVSAILLGKVCGGLEVTEQKTPWNLT